MPAPPITITCDCGTVGRVAYGERLTCDECGRTWDTAQIPSEEYDTLIESVRRYRALALGPPFAAAAVLVPLAVLSSFRFAFLLFVLVLAHALLVMPQLRRRASARLSATAPRWNLEAEKP